MYAFYSVFPSFCKVIHRPRLHRGDWSESNPYFFEEREASLTLTSSVYICQVATLILIESSSIRILLIVDNSFLSIACPRVADVTEILLSLTTVKDGMVSMNAELWDWAGEVPVGRVKGRICKWVSKSRGRVEK
jgi:hypothetical protein